MKIIQIEARKNGGRPNIQTWSGAACPAGFVFIPDDFDDSVFVQYRGFVNIKHKDGYLTKMTGNKKALDAYLAEYPDPNPKKAEYEAEIAELKQKLADTDYQVIKHADGALTDEEYQPIKAQRAEWRARINELEELIAAL